MACRMWRLEEQAWHFPFRRPPGQTSHSLCVNTTRACQTRTAAAWPHAQRSHWGLAASAPARRSSPVLLKRSQTACGSARHAPMILRAVASARPEADAPRQQSHTRTCSSRGQTRSKPAWQVTRCARTWGGRLCPPKRCPQACGNLPSVPDPRLVRRMLAGLGVARRHMRKGLPGGDAPPREAQVRHLAPRMHACRAAGTPVLRMETKKKA
jgi:hypothetical protein